MRPLSQPVPPPSSARGQRDNDDEDDDDEGRTVVRGAPKVVKRTNAAAKSSVPPASISPAAVIKTTLESARANRRELLPGPPADLLEDRSDFERSEPPGFDRKDQLELDRDRKDEPDSRKEPPFERSAPIRSHQQPAAFARTLPAAAFENPPAPRPPLEGPPSYPPAAHYGQSHLGAKPANAPYGASSPQVVPPAPASVPAHFMTPQAPYSDPPGMAVTNNSRVVGRPTISWAAALLACGLFVGVAAVAVMQTSESVADTTASFVDTSRAPRSNGGHQQHQQHAAPPTPVPVTPAGVPLADPNAPAGLIGASPVAPPPVAPPAARPEDPGPQAPVAAPVASAPAVTPPVATAPVVTPPVATAPVVTPPVATAPVVVAPAAWPQGTVVGGFAPVAVPAAPAPQAAPKKPTWTWRPSPPAPAKPVARAAADEEPKKPTKAAAEKPKKKGNSDADDETRKALEALQKAQLESASSFGKD
jgi:hypothetical protein